MSVRIIKTDVRVMNMRTRLPFKYGITTLTALPHAFVRVELDVDGKRRRGTAADHLPPKWFTKDPATHFRDDIADMLACIEAALSFATAAGDCPTVAEVWARTYRHQKKWGEDRKYPALLWHFGVSLVERAAIEAFCGATKQTFAAALRSNSLGGFDEDRRKLLPEAPLERVIARHTVGLIDPITDAEIPPAERVDDGLPQSLQEVIRAYGTKHFKIKLGGSVEHDTARLRRLAEVIETRAPRDYAFSLDGNENFKAVEPFRALWTGLNSDPSLRGFLSRVLFVEQPFHRDVALSDEVARHFARWPERPPMIIDESDGDAEALPRALECGYAGTSHKNCKGVFKSVANAALIARRRRQEPSRTFLLSGEDLANVGPVALLQDLAVAASLGIESIERNGHHYFRGLSMHSPDVQGQTLEHHGDLYRRHEQGFATVRIEGGMMDIASTLAAPLGVGFETDVESFPAPGDWRFDSLGLE